MPDGIGRGLVRLLIWGAETINRAEGDVLSPCSISLVPVNGGAILDSVRKD